MDEYTALNVEWRRPFGADEPMPGSWGRLWAKPLDRRPNIVSCSACCTEVNRESGRRFQSQIKDKVKEACPKAIPPEADQLKGLCTGRRVCTQQGNELHSAACSSNTVQPLTYNSYNIFLELVNKEKIKSPYYRESWCIAVATRSSALLRCLSYTL